MAVRRMPRMYGMPQGAMDGGAAHAQDVRYAARSHGKIIAPCIIFIPYIHVGNGDAAMYRKYGIPH